MKPPFVDQLDGFENVSPALAWAMFIVICLIAVVALISVCVSIYLAIKYVSYNRRLNSKGLTGRDAARTILDNNGLEHIKVSTFGSFLFGNSYSHYFKKVRLRRWTADKATVTSLAMGAEKAGLAILDKEKDPDMKTRVAFTPLIYFGPLAFIPLVAVGVLIDIFVFNFTGVVTLILTGIGLLFYVISFILSVMVLKTEVKAQKKAIEVLRKDDLATEEELGMMQELYRLYNIQYINDIILEFLQMILKILQFVAKIQSSSSSKN